MKSDKLFEYLDNIDDKYIADAQITSLPSVIVARDHTFSNFFKSAVSAAAIFLVIGMIFVWTLVGKDLLGSHQGDDSTNATTTAAPITTTTPTTPIDPTPSFEYNYTEHEYKEPTYWNHANGDVWEYLYISKSNISETLDTSLIKPCLFEQSGIWYTDSGRDAEPLFYAPVQFICMAPTDNRASVLAFVAPDDCCYSFDVNLLAENTLEGDSGVNCLIFADQKCIYSHAFTEDGDVDTEFTVSLKKGERVFFVADSISSAFATIKFWAEVTRISDVYIDNTDAWLFGDAYLNKSTDQGTNGWYAGYVSNDSPINKSSFEEKIPEWMLEGDVFGVITDANSKAPHLQAMVLWEAPKAGKYTVQVSLVASDASISFYCGNEKIATRDFVKNDQFVCTMEVELEKGEAFALTLNHSDSARTDAAYDLSVIIS